MFLILSHGSYPPSIYYALGVGVFLPLRLLHYIATEWVGIVFTLLYLLCIRWSGIYYVVSVRFPSILYRCFLFTHLLHLLCSEWRGVFKVIHSFNIDIFTKITYNNHRITGVASSVHCDIERRSNRNVKVYLWKASYFLYELYSIKIAKSFNSWLIFLFNIFKFWTFNSN